MERELFSSVYNKMRIVLFTLKYDNHSVYWAYYLNVKNVCTAFNIKIGTKFSGKKIELYVRNPTEKEKKKQ